MTDRQNPNGTGDIASHRALASRCKTEELLGLSNEDLARVDPLEMNLVAKGIPSLAHLDVRQYQATADEWAQAIREELLPSQAEFHRTPQDWKNDIRFFRLGVVCWYVDHVLGIRCREDERDLKRVLYTDPADGPNGWPGLIGVLRPPSASCLRSRLSISTSRQFGVASN